MFAGQTYASALAQAQRLGFAEADPTNDVEGIDAAHKLAILAQLAFRRGLITHEIPRAGITRLSVQDVTLAKRLGWNLKLVACARADASLVAPAYVRPEHPFAQPVGAQNCIRVTGRSTGSLTFAGTGAGSEPTASAVIGDVVAVLRLITAGRHVPGIKPVASRLVPVRRDVLEPSIPLRRVIRLRTLGDVRPAREALAGNGIPAEPLENVPAVITSRPERGAPGRFEAALAQHGVHAQSVIGLWEDLAPSAVRRSSEEPTAARRAQGASA